MKILISSVQKEFAIERKALADYLSGDPLLRRFFETFLYERDVPASARRPDSVYVEEVRNCDLYPTKYIERMGTGTRDMIKNCLAAGLPEPEFSLTDSFVTTIQRNAVSKSHHVGSLNTPPVAGQVTGQVDPWILRGLTACAANPLTSRDIQEATGLRHRETFQRNYLDQLLGDELLERTIPENPTSRLQKYRLTEKGKALIEQLDTQGGNP